MKMKIKTVFLLMLLPLVFLIVYFSFDSTNIYKDVYKLLSRLEADISFGIKGGEYGLSIHRAMNESTKNILSRETFSEKDIQTYIELSKQNLNDWGKNLMSNKSESETMAAWSSVQSEHKDFINSIQKARNLTKDGKIKEASEILEESEDQVEAITRLVDGMIAKYQARIDQEFSALIRALDHFAIVRLEDLISEAEDIQRDQRSVSRGFIFSQMINLESMELLEGLLEGERSDYEDYYTASVAADIVWREMKTGVETEYGENVDNWPSEATRINGQYQKLNHNIEHLLELIEQGKEEQAFAFWKEGVDGQIKNHLLPSMEGLIADVKADLFEDIEEIKESANWNLLVIFIVSFLVIGLSLFIFIFLYRKLLIPILTIKESVLKFGAGDYDTRIDVKCLQEIEELGVAFNKMAAELRKTNDRLLQSEKMSAVGQLAGGIAHEINNPLGIILGYSQIANSKIKKGDPLTEPMKLIEQEAHRCKALVQDLLTFSNSSKNDHKERVGLKKVIESSLALVQARVKTTKIKLKIELAPDLPDITMNQVQIQQVIINLANNAVDAMGDDGRLYVGARVSSKHPNSIEIQIKDTGSGIPKEIRGKIFEPFFTTKALGKGTGLGLALSYEIVKRHQGFIDVKSDSGQGTQFTVTLPIRENQNIAKAA